MILHELTVGQTVILSQRADTDPGSPDPSEGPLGRVMLGEFRRDYDEAAALEFTLFRPWNEVAFQADQLVTLRLTNTETGVSRIVFTGLLDPVRPIASVRSRPSTKAPHNSTPRATIRTHWLNRRPSIPTAAPASGSLAAHWARWSRST